MCTFLPRPLPGKKLLHSNEDLYLPRDLMEQVTSPRTRCTPAKCGYCRVASLCALPSQRFFFGTLCLLELCKSTVPPGITQPCSPKPQIFVYNWLFFSLLTSLRHPSRWFQKCQCTLCSGDQGERAHLSHNLHELKLL